MSQVDCCSPCEFVGVQVILNHVYPFLAVSYSLQVMMKLESAGVHSGDVPEQCQMQCLNDFDESQDSLLGMDAK